MQQEQRMALPPRARPDSRDPWLALQGEYLRQLKGRGLLRRRNKLVTRRGLVGSGSLGVLRIKTAFLKDYMRWEHIFNIVLGKAQNIFFRQRFGVVVRPSSCLHPLLVSANIVCSTGKTLRRSRTTLLWSTRKEVNQLIWWRTRSRSAIFTTELGTRSPNTLTLPTVSCTLFLSPINQQDFIDYLWTIDNRLFFFWGYWIFTRICLDTVFKDIYLSMINYGSVCVFAWVAVTNSTITVYVA